MSQSNDSGLNLDHLEALARAATPQNLDSAQDATKPTGYIECPECGGDGTVELTADYCNYDGKALGVQFYGIGPEHQAAEAFFRAANPSAVLELIALARRATQPVAAPTTGDAHPGLMAEIDCLNHRIAVMKNELQMRHQKDTGDVWYWQGDGTDSLGSMSVSMTVVINAADLRALAALIHAEGLSFGKRRRDDQSKEIAALRAALANQPAPTVPTMSAKELGEAKRFNDFISPDVDDLADSLSRIAAPAPAVQAAKSPFMYAILKPNGKPHFDEHCVDDNAESLRAETQLMSELHGESFAVVPVYLGAHQPAQKQPELQYRTCCDHPDCTTCAGHGGFYRLAAPQAPVAAEPVAAQHEAGDERAAFERHKPELHLRRVGVERDGSGGWYENPCVQSAWEGWQTRATLDASPVVRAQSEESAAPTATTVGSRALMDQWNAGAALLLFQEWKGYPLPPLNSDGNFDKDWLHREWVAFQAGLKRRPAAGTQQAHAGADEAGKLKALHAAISAIYFDDSSDFRSALGSVVRHLDPALAGELLGSPKAAYDQVSAAIRAAQEGGAA